MKNWNKIFKKKYKNNNFKIKNILDELNFWPTFKIFNVVGTNGKGSVSSYINQGFSKKFAKVGFFQSPHLQKPNERISINNKSISNKDFWKLYQKIKIEKISFFSILFIVAMLYFKKQKCDVVILESGIGGQHDVTNIYPGNWGVVTSIGLDHLALLGNSEQKIALDKSKIINENMIFYLPSIFKKKLQEIFIKTAQMQKATIIKIDNKEDNYQKQNMKLAQNILKHCLFLEMKKFKIPAGRTEIFKHNNLTTIFDVAHNKDGFIASLKVLEQKKIDFKQVIITLSKTKEIEGIKKLFIDKEIFIWRPNTNFYSSKDFKTKKIDNIKSFYKKQNKTTLYIGSFQLIGFLYKNK